MNYGPSTDALKALGFSEIEALVYCFLLRRAPATGYRVAKGIGKAATNVYAAIESLAQKGALLIDDDAARQCRAVPPRELGDALEAQFKRRREKAETALQSLTADAPDQHIYKLETQDQVFARVNRMIDQSRDHVLVDAFPGPLGVIEDALASASERGVKIAIETYSDDIDTPYALTAQSAYDHRQPAPWPGQQLNIVVDAREFVLALFDQKCESVLQAVWSTSGYLACLQHSYMASSLLARQCEHDGLLQDPKLKRLKALALTSARPSGLATFITSYSQTEAGDAA